MPDHLPLDAPEQLTLEDAAVKNEHVETLQRLVTDAVKKTGSTDSIQTGLRGFADRMFTLARLNEQVKDLSSHTGNAESYEQLVSKIMAATQEYYDFIGAQPEEIRQILTHMGFSGVDFADLPAGLLPEEEVSRLSPPSLMPVQSIRPKSYIMQLDTISNHLTTLSGQTDLKVGKRGSQPVRTTVTLDMPEHMQVEGGQLTTYDKSIVNAVTSLIESGNMAFSIPMLYHAMTGRQNPTVDDALTEELTARIEKMRMMMLTIDLTEEARARMIGADNPEIETVDDVQLNGYLMPLARLSGVINGKPARVYQIMQAPPLYQYAKLKRQLATVAISLLSAPVNNTETTIPLKTYLLQRIELMKNKKNAVTSNKILYSSIYEELGATDAGKTKKARIRGYTEKILAHFVDEQYITSYSSSKSGRTVDGVLIHLSQRANT